MCYIIYISYALSDLGHWLIAVSFFSDSAIKTTKKLDMSPHSGTAAVTPDHVTSQPDSTDEILNPGIRHRTVTGR